MSWRTTEMQVVGVIGLLAGCASGRGLGVYDKPGGRETGSVRLSTRIGQRE